MLTHGRFSCYLIGEETLIVHCAEYLLKKSHLLLGIVSSNQSVKEWAQAHQVLYIDSLSALQNTIKSKPADYLFSFINPQIIKAGILQHIKKFAINYHNALLPHYAGLHATSWAILNNEKEHGISWHIITQHIDSGDILKQASFPINNNDNAISLDHKCLFKGIEAFNELVTDLEMGKIERIKQNLTQRNYFSLAKKPFANALICWADSGQKIDRLYRALYFPNYTNRFALPKFLLADKVLIPRELTVLNRRSGLAPGTIAAYTSDYWQICTGTEDISIGQLVDINGNEYLLNDLRKKYRLTKHFQLPVITENFLQYLDKQSAPIHKHEGFWVELFENLPQVSNIYNTLGLTQSNKINPQSSSVEYHHLNISLKNYFPDFCAYNQQQLFLLSVILIYLYRINNYEPTCIALSTPTIYNTIIDLEEFFSTHVPLSVSLHPEMQFYEVMASVKKQLQVLESHLTYSRDLECRFPSLKGKTTSFALQVDILTSKKIPRLITDNTIALAIQNDANKLSLFYNPHHISKNQKILIKNLLHHLKILFENISINPEKAIKDLHLLTTAEERVLSKWNKTDAKLQKNDTLTKAFQKQVKRSPAQIALEFNGIKLTYEQLNHRANQLAHYLIKKGVLIETPVAICFERSIDMIVSILAILKAGGAYVPIDPTYPHTMIQHILNDSDVIFIITNKKLLKLVNKLSNNATNLIFIDPDNTSNESTQNPITTLSAKNLAYIIYTSGSTGFPKGVQIEHKGVINLVQFQANVLNISTHSRVLNFASLCFDASVWEIFITLLAGGTLCLVKQIQLLSGNSLVNILNKFKITVVTLPPSILNIMPKTKLNYLQTLILAGEPSSESMVKRWLNLPLKIINAYGPTEATVCSTLYVVPSQYHDRPVIPIGRPLKNVKTFVLDKYQQLMPLGIQGELWIAGIGLARGYFNKPNLTNEKFIKNPFSSNAESNIYRTGDLARWLPDGNLEFIGRTDNQEKIRGFRVELNAIETCLLQYELISQAVVLAQTDIRQNKYLAAYIIPRDNNHHLSYNNLHEHLASRLPEYMIPSMFYLLDSFPLTHSGKIDKKILLNSHPKHHISEPGYTIPVTSTQKKLTRIWQQLLNINHIGINDNFFNLGGHSLLVAELLMRIRKSFHVNISINAFLTLPTIASLAHAIDTHNSLDNNNENIRMLTTASILPTRIKPNDSYHYYLTDIIPKSILLTGATGFLGVHLLNDIHQWTTADIYCLIRATEEVTALKQLENSLLKFQLKNLLNSPRIKILLGDLEKPLLGLTPENFNELADIIDVIYHNAAYVNHIYSYQILKSTNVDGTLSLLEFASLGKPKKIHYISTLAAAITNNQNDFIKESFPLAKPELYVLLGGYEQTKWVSERLIAQAYERGIEVTIFRLGWIGGQSNTGICTANKNHFLSFIKSCIQMQIAPDINIDISMLPVDFASNAIIQISLQNKSIGKVFNMQNSNTIAWPTLIETLNKQLNYNIKLVPYSAWQEKLIKDSDSTNVLYPFLPLFLRGTNTGWLDLQNRLALIEDKNINEMFKLLNISYPAINQSLLKVYFNYLLNSGFLPHVSPQEKSSVTITIDSLTA